MKINRENKNYLKPNKKKKNYRNHYKINLKKMNK